MLACRCCARFTITGLGGEENCLTSVVTLEFFFFFFFKEGGGEKKKILLHLLPQARVVHFCNQVKIKT